MKPASLASVLTIVLGVTSAYAATAETTTAKDGVAVQGGAILQSDGIAADQRGTQTDSEDYRNGPVTKTTERSSPQIEADDSELTKDVKKNLNKAGNEMRETADDIKAFFVGDDGVGGKEPLLIRRDRTAHGLLDQPVLNGDGKEICKLQDIIVDANGKAILAVVSDGGFLGIGNKVAAFDYGKVIAQQKDGKVVMALSQDMIDKAADFSYDADDRAKAKVIPADSISVKDLLDGELMDSADKKAASIDNVTFEDGMTKHVIVGFNKKLGLGGDLAALNFASLKKINNKGEVDLQMNAAQSTQFQRLSETSMK